MGSGKETPGFSTLESAWRWETRLSQPPECEGVLQKRDICQEGRLRGKLRQKGGGRDKEGGREREGEKEEEEREVAEQRFLGPEAASLLSPLMDP